MFLSVVLRSIAHVAGVGPAFLMKYRPLAIGTDIYLYRPLQGRPWRRPREDFATPEREVSAYVVTVGVTVGLFSLVAGA